MNIKNTLLFPIKVQRILADGSLDPKGVLNNIDPGDTESLPDGHTPAVGDSLRIQFSRSGSLVTTITVTDAILAANPYKITVNALMDPSAVPNPTFQGPWLTYVVGQGKDKHDGHTIVRERWWFATDQSVSLAPGETRTWSIEYVEGVENSTTSLTNITSEIGGSVTGGWGPVSATLSASLSVSSSVEQTVTLNTSRTASESSTITNPNLQATLNVRAFQMLERYSVWNLNGDHNTPKVAFVNDTNLLMTVASTQSVGSTS